MKRITWIEIETMERISENDKLCLITKIYV